jgi:hypothetical protein
VGEQSPVDFARDGVDVRGCGAAWVERVDGDGVRSAAARSREAFMNEELYQPGFDEAVRAAILESTCSPCRSKRGAAVFSMDRCLSSGYNFKPRGFDCDGTVECKATCSRQAIHAEMAALFRLPPTRLAGLEMLHVKTVDGARQLVVHQALAVALHGFREFADGQLVPSPEPSCVECSKHALVLGIAGFWLYHADGWKRYEMSEFHRLSIENARKVSQEKAEVMDIADDRLTRVEDGLATLRAMFNLLQKPPDKGQEPYRGKPGS